MLDDLWPWCWPCLDGRHNECEPDPWCECVACLPHDDELPLEDL